MACSTLITADIVQDCTKVPVKGLKPKAWIFNMGEATITKTANLISNLVKVAGKSSFTCEGFKDFMNAGYDAVIAENMPSAFTHYWSVVSNAATAAEKANIDKADNIMIVVQKNGLQEQGCFVAYGITNGLWKSSQTKRANDANGTATVEFTSREGMTEEYSEYVVWITDYATTLAALVASETV